MIVNAHSIMQSWHDQYDDLVVQIAEELWQKGYDIQRNDKGWIVKKPIVGEIIQLASDVDLLKYSVGRVKCVVPEIALKKQKDYASITQPESCSDITQKYESVISKSSTPETYKPLIRAWVMNGALPLLLVIALGTLVVIGILTLGILSKEHGELSVSGLTADSGQKSVNANPSEEVIPRSDHPKIGKSESLDPFYGGGNTETDIKQSNTDLSDVIGRCILQLRGRFKVDNLSLLISPRSSRDEECFEILSKEHCPYQNKGRVVLIYIDKNSPSLATYACDVNVNRNSIESMRVVQTNPDVVRFLLTEAAMTR